MAGGATDTPAAASNPPAQLPDLEPAQWIWYPSGRVLANTFVLFRRVVELPAAPRRATGWIAAESRYRLEVNGQRVQWGPAPGDPRWPEADPIDLTGMLRAGANAIGATVLFYGHGDGTWPIGKPGFLFWLEIEHADGTMERMVSDGTWQAHLCRAWPAGQYKRWFLRALQEEFDARLYPEGWSEASFTPDADWLDVMPLTGLPNQPALMTRFTEYASDLRTGPANSELRRRSIPLLDEIPIAASRLAESIWLRWLRPPDEYFECRPPRAFEVDREPSAEARGDREHPAWQVHGDGCRGAALTFEFDEQIVGWPYFTVEAPAGTVIELLVQEAHEVGGPALLDTGRDSWTRFICREGVNQFECFDYESLRWLQLHVRPTDAVVTIRDVGMRRRIYPWPNAPRLHNDEPALQRLFDASINTLNNCAQDVIVDGMGRERQQYSGDCGHQLPAIRLVFGETRSPARFLTTYSQGLTTEGYFLDCWPAYDRLERTVERQLDMFHLGPILDHGVQFNFDCWRHWMDTGDLAALAEPMPRLLRFAEYLRGSIGNDGLLPVEHLGIPSVWIDYQAYGQRSGMPPEMTQRRKQCAFNLYAAAMFEHALAPLCRATGRGEQAEAMEALGRNLLAAATKKFWSPERQLFVNNLPWLNEDKRISLCDRSLANAVLFEQCPGGMTAAAVRALADRVPEMGLSYPANAGWRLRALAKAGRVDVIVRELRERWATMDSVRLNNTLQEGWKTSPDSPRQWSHCAVAPLYITIEGLAGIRALEPGFRRVEIRPQLADLRQLELTAYLPAGPLGFEARGERGKRKLSLTLPTGCAGELLLPSEQQVPLEEIPGAVPADHRRWRLAAGQTITLDLTHV